MKFFGVCLILGGAGLFYGEVVYGGCRAIPLPGETSQEAFVHFFEAQAILVGAYFIPWVAATLGLTLLLRRAAPSCKPGRNTDSTADR